jgi:hypothetical protein
MWNSRIDNDFLDFALLWEPLGGPAPENVAAAFAIDMWEYHRRLQDAARFWLARFQQGTACAERIYGHSAITALTRDPAKRT